MTLTDEDVVGVVKKTKYMHGEPKCNRSNKSLLEMFDANVRGAVVEKAVAQALGVDYGVVSDIDPTDPRTFANDLIFRDRRIEIKSTTKETGVWNVASYETDSAKTMMKFINDIEAIVMGYVHERDADSRNFLVIIKWVINPKSFYLYKRVETATGNRDLFFYRYGGRNPDLDHLPHAMTIDGDTIEREVKSDWNQRTRIDTSPGRMRPTPTEEEHGLSEPHVDG